MSNPFLEGDTLRGKSKKKKAMPVIPVPDTSLYSKQVRDVCFSDLPRVIRVDGRTRAINWEVAVGREGNSSVAVHFEKGGGYQTYDATVTVGSILNEVASFIEKQEHKTVVPNKFYKEVENIVQALDVLDKKAVSTGRISLSSRGWADLYNRFHTLYAAITTLDAITGDDGKDEEYN